MADGTDPPGPSYVDTTRVRYKLRIQCQLTKLLMNKNICLICLDANCGTVVPSQVSLSQMEVGRHTEVGYVRNRTLEGQR